MIEELPAKTLPSTWFLVGVVVLGFKVCGFAVYGLIPDLGRSYWGVGFRFWGLVSGWGTIKLTVPVSGTIRSYDHITFVSGFEITKIQILIPNRAFLPNNLPA